MEEFDFMADHFRLFRAGDLGAGARSSADGRGTELCSPPEELQAESSRDQLNRLLRGWTKNS